MHLLLQQLHDSIGAQTKNLTPEQLNRHAEGKWSIAQILEHLSLTYSGTSAGCERCLKADRTLATSATLKQRFATAVVVKLGYMPPGRKAPEMSIPRGTPGETVLANIQRNVVAMDQAIHSCEERFGNRVKLMDHPILGPLTTEQWRKLHWVHGRHHLRQIERLQKSVTQTAGVK